MWEDDKNSAGGRWLLKLPPVKNNLHIDEYWKNIVRNKLYFSIYLLIIYIIIFTDILLILLFLGIKYNR